MRFKQLNGHFIVTSKANSYYPHYHYVEVDKKGNGKTIDTSSGPPHIHEFINFKSDSDGMHDHVLSDETITLIKSEPYKKEEM